ncbi:MAG TPA: ABC transporter permease [Blastocatellia bacterium]|nr:ABC transporter permease [Blastocatellia bacterium]
MVSVAFANLLWRDIWVTLRNWPSFLAQNLMQPVFFLFIFASVLPKLGQTNGGYSTMLLPGIIALTTLLTAMQSVSLPLAIEFGYTKEIEDRLLSPLPVWAIAVQKMVFASIRGLLGGALILPLGRLIIGTDFTVSTSHPILLATVAVLGALGGSALGLTLGTVIQPAQIGLWFSLVLTPLLFTGCVYYPWALLSRLRWFQVVTCFSPLTYTSEGFRAALAPVVPHMPVPFITFGQVAFLILFGYIGIRSFGRKAVD